MAYIAIAMMLGGFLWFKNQTKLFTWEQLCYEQKFVFWLAIAAIAYNDPFFIYKIFYPSGFL